ncbi:hypothetical protein DPMN_057843 [Dreissena polymorpha]|uniref:Uncharacterized protein n=1 Tax=Dreissena polymorpha TaxID=45954 RepID=A0A9D4C0P2_DREPO|nr:hypothetical protein DPMN_057843 [Dreissena polymorpha]
MSAVSVVFPVIVTVLLQNITCFLSMNRGRQVIHLIQLHRQTAERFRTREDLYTDLNISTRH